MRCPFCFADDTRVIDSRAAETGAAVRRRRLCEECDNRFTTYERASLLMVRKRDGRTEPLDLDKTRAGLERALADQSVPKRAVERILARVEKAARVSGGITTEEIGDIVLSSLRDIDEVAYLRFASVYKDFRAAQDFEREMAELEDEPA